MPGPRETIEVGDIEFTQMPLIAAGTVRDTGGTPLKGVDIQTGEKINVVEETGDFDWSFAGLGTAFTDTEGRFELRGILPPGEYALWPRLRGHQNRGFIAFQHGDRSVDLVLDVSTSLSGKVLLPTEVPEERIHVELRYHGVDPKQAFYHETVTSLGFEGEFLFQDLRPGHLDLIVRTGRLSEPSHLQGDLVLEPGASGEDAQLPTIDLRDKLRLIDVLVLGDAGDPVERGYVTIGERSYQLLEGRARVITRAGPADLVVRAPGYLESRTLAAKGQNILRLQRAIPVELRLSTDLPPAAPGLQVAVGLQPREGFESRLTLFDENEERTVGESSRLRVEYQRIDGSGGAFLHVPNLGEYLLQWMIVKELGSSGGRLGGWVGEFSQRVKIEARGMRIDLDPDLEVYAEALREHG